MVLVFHRNKKLILPRNNDNGDMEMEENRTRIGLLCDIVEEAGSITEISTLLKRILIVTQHTLGASVTTLFLNDNNKAQVHSPVTVNKYEETARYGATIIESEIAGLVASNVTPVFINNVSTDAHFNPKGTAIRSIIAAPILRGKRVIGVLIAANKEDGGEFTEGDFEVLKGFSSTEALILLVSMEISAIDNVNRPTLDRALMEGYRSTIHEPANAIDAKDTYAYAHSRRAKEYALLAANSLSLTPQELQAIEFGALLHDIGKIGIDRNILYKPGPLTDEEWNIIHEHPQKGASILEDIPYLKEAMNIVLHHHERYDGKGYPKRLKGDEIPIGARLVAVAEAFDVMTTDHSYRAALSVNEALRELIECTGTQFCPKAIEAFVSAFKKYDGHQPIKKNYIEIKPKAVKEAENLKVKADKEVENLKTKADREAGISKIKAEKEAENLKLKADREAENSKTKAEKEAENSKVKADREAESLKIKADREAENSKTKADREAENSKTKADKEAKEVKKPAKERKPTSANTDSEISKGNIRLVVPITVNTEEVKKLREELEKIEGITILMLSHAEEEGHLFLLSLEKPMTLMRFVKEIPQVEDVDRKGKEILVTLRDESSLKGAEPPISLPKASP